MIDKRNEGRGERPEQSTVVTEFEFPTTPIGRLRRWLHQWAGVWALRHVVQQQNRINATQNRDAALLKESLHTIDHELVESRKKIAELTVLIVGQQQEIERLKGELAERAHQRPSKE